MTEERLQKIIARAGLASRRGAEDLIRQGKVTVNGKVAEIGGKADPQHDAILINGKRLKTPTSEVFLLLNKPAGCVVSRSDPQGRRTVMDLLAPRFRKSVVPAGRLDYESEGLLVLTSDGDLIQKITHPRYGCIKTYEVKVKGIPAESTMRRFRDGIVIDGKRTAPAHAALLHRPRHGKGEKNSWWTVRLVEGRKRQIREMFFRLGHPVQRLRRIAIGGLSDPNLPVGAYRHIDPDEIRNLLGKSRAPRKQKSRSGRSSKKGATKAKK